MRWRRIKKSPPSVSFYLYDEFKEMSLRHFCAVCRIPYEGELEEPHREDVGGFVKTIAVEEPNVTPPIQSYTNHARKRVRSRSGTHGKISQHNSKT